MQKWDANNKSSFFIYSFQAWHTRCVRPFFLACSFIYVHPFFDTWAFIVSNAENLYIFNRWRPQLLQKQFLPSQWLLIP